MIKKFLTISILIFLLFALTGCSSPSGIDSYYFIISIGLDKSDSGIKVTIQIPSNSSEESSGGSSSSSQSSDYELYSVEASTIDECLTILNNYLNKKINLSHCSALIISEDLAKEGIRTYINTLSNNTELRHSCDIIICQSTSSEVQENVSNSGTVYSARLYDYLTTSSEYTGYTIQSNFGQFFQALNNSYYEPTAIYTQVLDSTVQTIGLAVFKEDKMIGHMDVSDSIAHLMTINKFDSGTITIDSPLSENEKIDLDINLYKKTKISTDIINGSPLITIDVYPEGSIKSSGTIFDYIDSEKIHLVEKATNNYLTSIFKDYLYTITKEYNSDVVGFKGICQAKYLTKEEFDKIHWDEIFKDSFFVININTKINSSNLFNKE